MLPRTRPRHGAQRGHDARPALRGRLAADAVRTEDEPAAERARGGRLGAVHRDRAVSGREPEQGGGGAADCETVGGRVRACPAGDARRRGPHSGATGECAEGAGRHGDDRREHHPHVSAALGHDSTNADPDLARNDLPSTRQAAVQARLEILQEALDTSECPPEATNIRAAIQAYRDGAIQPSRWTLFWNGHLVDTCESYRTFCEDREERLDRYAREHGPGWLWYEAPLEDHGQPPLAMGATSLRQNSNLYDLGSWNTTLGFRRVKSYVSRDGTAPPRAGSVHRRRQPGRAIMSSHLEVKEVEYVVEEQPGRKSASGLKQTKAHTYILADDPTAPHVYFDLLLDSGATFPLIYKHDLGAMGVNPDTYPAQTVVDITSVDGSFVTRLYELRVDIPASNGRSLVDPRRPVHPSERPELGAVVPVAILPPQPPHAPPPSSPVRLHDTRRGERHRRMTPGLRLSGMLPFTACYVSVVPGSQTLWLGEDRRDVLGAFKFPGQRRLFCSHGGSKERGLREMAMAPPAVRFEHQLTGGGKLVDEDVGLGVSEVGLWDANGEETASSRVGPRNRKKGPRSRGEASIVTLERV